MIATISGTDLNGRRPMNVLTILAYLLGRREAVLQIVACPAAVWVGAAFVLSAALAREYDGHDLLHEPGHLALPFVASLVTSFLLFCLVRTVGKLRGIGEVPFWRTYRSFLGLYWMTAPLAWLYAIPVERFLSPVDAVKANLTLLGIVSLWRVLLITRAISVLFSCRFLAALPVVLLFADTVAIISLVSLQLSLVGIMGGIHLSEPQQWTLQVANFVSAAGAWTFLVWLVAAVYVARRGGAWALTKSDAVARFRVRPGLWAFAVASVIAWGAVLPATQREQRLAYDVERDLIAGRYAEAVNAMTARDQSEFPPNWRPPVGSPYSLPNPIDVTAVAVERNAAPWVRAVFFENLAGFVAERNKMSRLDKAGVDSFLDLLLRVPEGPALADAHREALEMATERDARPETREKIQRLLKMADEYRAAQQSSPIPAP